MIFIKKHNVQEKEFILLLENTKRSLLKRTFGVNLYVIT